MVKNNYILKLRNNLKWYEEVKLADASVLLAITDEDEPKIVLTQRSMYISHAGEVSLVGGKRDPQDKDNIATALREAKEEIALNPQTVQILGELPQRSSKSGLSVQPIVGMIPADTQFLAQDIEIAKIFLLPIQTLIQAETKPYWFKYANQKQKICYSSIHYDGQIIWGLTALILMDFLRHGLGIYKSWHLLYSSP